MTTPSDKFQDDKPEKNDAEAENNSPSASSKRPPLNPGLPLYMRAPREALTSGVPESGGPSSTPRPAAKSADESSSSAHTASVPVPDSMAPGLTGEGNERRVPLPQSSGGSSGMQADSDCAAIAVDPAGTATCMPPDPAAKAGTVTKSGSEKVAGTDEGDKVWDYSARLQKQSSEYAPRDEKIEETPASPLPGPTAADNRKKSKKWFGKSQVDQRGNTARKQTSGAKEQARTYPPFSASHPILSVEQSMPPSVSSRLFSALALSPLIVLTIILLIQTIFSLDARALWLSDEIRHADAFKNLLDGGKWLILEMNGAPYPDKPPLYFWFLRGLYELLGTTGPLLYFTAAAVSGLLFLWASVGLGRQVARVDGKTNLAAGIILLSTGYFMGLLHYARMDLLFSALIICSNIALYRAFVSPRHDYIGMIAAFVLAGFACLVKGPLAFAFPLSSIVLFALWRGTRDQVRGVIFSIIAVLFALLPGVFGIQLLQFFGLNPPTIVNPFNEASILSIEWGLIFLAPPLVIGLILMALSPALRICTALSLVLMAAVFVLNGSTPYFAWPLIFTLPATALALFALWQATPQRFFRLDFFAGLAAGVLIPSLWLGAIYMETGSYDFILNALLKTQVLERAVDTFHHKEPWHYYLFRLPLMLLPWVLLIFFLPWQKIMGKQSREGIAASRTPEKEGLAYLWCMIISALAMLSLLSGKILIYMLPVLPAFTILGARGVLALSGSRAQFFRYAMAALLFLFGVASIIGGLMLFGVLPMPGFDFVPGWSIPSHGGFYVVGIIALVIAGLLAFGLGSSRPEGVLLHMALGCSLLGFPLASLVAPGFDAVLSPKAQALIMRAYIDEGYTPASYKVYGGTYSFYTGSVIHELKKQDEITPLAEKGKLVLGMRASIFDKWQDAPACLTEVHRQWIETNEFVLLACPPIEGLKPAQVPYKESPDLVRQVFRSVGIELPNIGGQSSAPVEQKIVRKASQEALPSPEEIPSATENQADPAEGADSPAEEKQSPPESPTPMTEDANTAQDTAPDAGQGAASGSTPKAQTDGDGIPPSPPTAPPMQEEAGAMPSAEPAPQSQEGDKDREPAPKAEEAPDKAPNEAPAATQGGSSADKEVAPAEAVLADPPRTTPKAQEGPPEDKAAVAQEPGTPPVSTEEKTGEGMSTDVVDEPAVQVTPSTPEPGLTPAPAPAETNTPKNDAADSAK